MVVIQTKGEVEGEKESFFHSILFQLQACAQPRALLGAVILHLNIINI